MVWMHNGRHRVRHFTRGKLCPSYDDIKERNLSFVVQNIFCE